MWKSPFAVLLIAAILAGCGGEGSGASSGGEGEEPAAEQGPVARADFAAMRSDLLSLRTAEEVYYQTGGEFTYTLDLRALQFAPSSGVSVTVTGADGHAWAAVAAHQAAGERVGCAIAYGDLDRSDVRLPSTPGGKRLTPSSVGEPVCD